MKCFYRNNEWPFIHGQPYFWVITYCCADVSEAFTFFRTTLTTNNNKCITTTKQQTARLIVNFHQNMPECRGAVLFPRIVFRVHKCVDFLWKKILIVLGWSIETRNVPLLWDVLHYCFLQARSCVIILQLSSFFLVSLGAERNRRVRYGIDDPFEMDFSQK